MVLKQRYPGAALVTGASSGIGESFAKSLAEEGFPLVLVARREERLQRLAETLREAHGVECLVLPEDLTVPGSADRILKAVEAKGWQVSLLVNNAGFGSLAGHTDLEGDLYTRMVDLNCRAPVELTNCFLPSMLEVGRGGIIFVSSVVAYTPAPYMAVYGATKGFNLLLAESLYAECKSKGVDVLSLAPGYTRTEFSQSAGVDVGMPGFLVGSSEAVVKKGLRSLGRKPSTIHGFLNWLLCFSIRFAPRRFVVWAASRVVRRSSPSLKGT